MKARIGSIEFDVSLEELDELVRRYGQGSDDPRVPTKPNAPSLNGVARDKVILDRFIQAAINGIGTKELGDLLGKHGRGVKPALRKWAIRIKLVTPEEANLPVEKARPGGGRGWRLRPTLLPVAEELVKGSK
jgi:hypothetical protein